MKVVDFSAVHEISNIHELEPVLMKRYRDGVNSFWLSHGDEEYPTLSVLVKDDLAALHYIPQENEAGFRSVGKMPGLKPGKTITFSISNNRADDVDVLSDAVLSFSAALCAAKEFFLSKDLPRSVEWLQL